MRDSGIPTIINGTLQNASTEYVITLPLNYHKLMVQARTNAAVKMSFVAGQSGTNYLTIKAGSSYFDDNLHCNQNLYVQTETAGTILEVLAWSGGPDAI